ncbi:MAG: hypothetical protein K2G44_00905 [Clostridia bacterium]|nr:hypothetical protein [Clostridia bacterium]
MKVKEFFKSTAFKSLAVLTAIVIIAGALLAIFNDLLFVSTTERRNRDFKKIYGGNIEPVSSTLQEDKNKKDSFVPVKIDGDSVTESWLMSDGSYAIQTIGTGGYKEGTITVWTVFECSGSKANNNLEWKGIRLVKYSSDDKQSYIGRFTSADYEQFAKHNSELLEGKMFDAGIDVIKTGASAPFTMGALTRAVNCAVTYFKTEILGVAEEPIYDYQSWVDIDNSEIPVKDSVDLATKTISYKLVMKKNPPAPSFTVNVTVMNGVITAYTHEGDYATDDSYASKVDGTIKDYSYFIGKTKEDILAIVKEDGGKLASADLGSLTTGATRSTESFLYAAAFALCNVDTCLYATEYEDWITDKTVTAEGTSVSYVLTVKKNAPAPSFTVNVTVDATGITAFTHEGNYATDDSYAGKVDGTISGYSFFIGKTKEDILAIVKEDGGKLAPADLGSLTTGATRSTESFLYAAAYALTNYEVYLAKLTEGGSEA